jgi:YD repeat-containing protein
VTDRNGNQTEYQFNNLGNIVKLRELTNRSIRSTDPTAYETTSVYNDDGELVKIVYPEGDSLEFDYDDSNLDRLQQGNVQVETRRADTDRGGDQAFLTTATIFEPLYGMPKTETEPRGNDPTFVPQNGGATSSARYTTRYTYDYEESCDFNAIGGAVGRSATSVQAMLTGVGICSSPLGDVNGDGITNQVAGNTIRVVRPSVRLLSGSNQALAEATTTQPIIELFAYDKFGLLISRTDPMGHVDTFDYHPENDPDGDGNDPTNGVGTGAFGYLKESVKDATGPPLKADLNADGVVDTTDLKLVSASLGTSDTTADVDKTDWLTRPTLCWSLRSSETVVTGTRPRFGGSISTTGLATSRGLWMAEASPPTSRLTSGIR